jgi:hypothetical protein
VRVTAQSPGNWRVSDRFTGTMLGDLRRPLEVRVPAGTFRLIELAR